MCTGGCGGGGMPNTNPKPSTRSVPNQPQQKNYVHRQSMGSSNGSRASQFGTPKVRATFSGRK